MAKQYFTLKRGPPETWACPSTCPTKLSAKSEAFSPNVASAKSSGRGGVPKGASVPYAIIPASRCRETSAEEGNRPEGTKDRLGDFAIKQDGTYITVFYVVLLFAPKPFLLSKPPSMHYVYIIVSVTQPERYYVGLTENVRQRLGHHNQGIVRSTAPFRPWRLRTAICFSQRNRAAKFERYLKTGSGIAFLRKRFL
jgi:putative endonuclease